MLQQITQIAALSGEIRTTQEKDMQGNAFARANMMMAAIAAAMSLAGTAQRQAMAGIGPYKSRGHGRGDGIPFGSSSHTVAMDCRGVHKVHGPKESRSKYTPHFGAKQQAKLQRQALKLAA